MSADAAATPPKRNALAALAAFAERRSLVMLTLGFASGLPFLLIFDTLSAWLRDAGLSLDVIAVFGLATLAYSAKFLWSPLVDRLAVPGLTKWLGHRRSWMLVCQAVVVLGLWLVSGCDPKTSLGLMAAFAVLVGFSGATQDIVIDAWRIEAATVERQGVMAAAYQWGYRFAFISAGAIPLVLAQQYSWHIAYAVMAAMMLIGVVGVLAAPREAAHEIKPIATGGVPPRPALEIPEWILRLALFAAGALILGCGLAADASLLAAVLGALGNPDAGAALKAAWVAKPGGVFWQLGGVLVGLGVIFAAAAPTPGLRTRPGVYLGAALGEPLRDFFVRYRGVAGLILALICFYRLTDFVLNIMNPFYLDLGFSKVQIAEVRKVFGVVATMAGVFLGGFAVARVGLMRAMVIGAFFAPVSHLAFAWLAVSGPDMRVLLAAIGIENAASAFAGTCLIAYMSSLTRVGFTATQYALFSSLYALPGKLLASQSGRIVEGAAKSADSGGVFAGLKGLFAGAPPTAFADAMTKSQVSPQALGAGYLVFFFYSAMIGVMAIGLALWVAARQPAEAAATETEV
ncbi:MAG: MFS transporter [Proteobacteria bacterium]|nr:MFS transporter [Pseudomonadota bacterium]